MLNRIGLFVRVAVLASLTGCAGKPPPPPSGFLSNYGTLQPAEGGAMRYVSPALNDYSSFIVEPVEIRSQRQSAQLKPFDQAQVAQYFRETLARTLTRRGYRIVQSPAAGVARIRIALTDVHEAKWWRGSMPEGYEAKGTGGASMEGEVVDSMTGAQLAAAIQTGSGGMDKFDVLSTMDDVKSTIDTWCRAAADRLDDLREAARAPRPR